MVLMEAKKSCKLTSVSISIFWPSRAPVGRRCGGQPSIIGPRLINEEGLTQQRERERAREGVEEWRGKKKMKRFNSVGESEWRRESDRNMKCANTCTAYS